MERQNPTMYRRALEELGAVLDRVDEASVDQAIDLMARARTVVVFGGGREGLQIRGFAMRLFHLGRSVAVVGDMTTPAVGPGDLFLVTVGPGEISTAVALVGVAKAAGAQVMVITAQPEGRVPKMADFVLVLPAQTMGQRPGPEWPVGAADGFPLRGRALRPVRSHDPETEGGPERLRRSHAGQPHQPRIAHARAMRFQASSPAIL